MTRPPPFLQMIDQKNRDQVLRLNNDIRFNNNSTIINIKLIDETGQNREAKYHIPNVVDSLTANVRYADFGYIVHGQSMGYGLGDQPSIKEWINKVCPLIEGAKELQIEYIVSYRHGGLDTPLQKIIYPPGNFKFFQDPIRTTIEPWIIPGYEDDEPTNIVSKIRYQDHWIAN